MYVFIRQKSVDVFSYLNVVYLENRKMEISKKLSSGWIDDDSLLDWRGK